MKQEKQLLLDEIEAHVTASKSFVVTQYEKLSAVKANEFRREMAKIDANFEVVRKRVFAKALKAASISFDVDQMPGHIGIVFLQSDPIEATKAIHRYSSENDKVFVLKAARYDGKIINEQQVALLATLPSKDEMRAQFLGLLEAPMAQTLSVIDQVLTSVVYCLDNKAQEGEKQG